MLNAPPLTEEEEARYRKEQPWLFEDESNEGPDDDEDTTNGRE